MMAFTNATTNSSSGGTNDSSTVSKGLDEKLLLGFEDFASLPENKGKTLVASVMITRPSPSGTGTEFLLLKRAREGNRHYNTWELPGGKSDMKIDQSIKSTACRELFEETGINLTEGDLIDPWEGFDHTRESDGKSWKQYCFKAHYQGSDTDTDVVLRPEEHSAYKWVSTTDGLDVADRMLEAIEKGIPLL